MSRDAWIAVIVIAVLAVAIPSLIGAVKLLIRLVRTRRLLGHLGAGAKVAFYGAIIYTILPVDLIPDPIYLDDMGVLGGALFYLGRLAVKRRLEHEAARAAGSATPASRAPVRTRRS
jgi:hypothetical protein